MGLSCTAGIEDAMLATSQSLGMLQFGLCLTGQDVTQKIRLVMERKSVSSMQRL